MKKKIEFNYNYTKLRDQKTAELVRVKIVSRTELDEEMVKIDTEHVVSHPVPAGQKLAGSTISEFKHYHLPNGSLLLLAFLGDRNIPFVSLRRFKDATWRMYKSQLNHVFEIVVKKKEV